MAYFEPSYSYAAAGPMRLGAARGQLKDERVEMKAFADLLLGLDSLPASAFCGSWQERPAWPELPHSHESIRTALISPVWVAPSVRADEVLCAHECASHLLGELSAVQLSQLAFGLPLLANAHLAKFRVAPPAPPVLTAASAVPHGPELGSCHQCKRRIVVRRCEHSQPIHVLRSGAIILEEERCRRSFCTSCSGKYSNEDASDPLYRSGIFRCPSCRGLCTCKSCLRTRAGGPKPGRRSKQLANAAVDPADAAYDAPSAAFRVHEGEGPVGLLAAPPPATAVQQLQAVQLLHAEEEAAHPLASQEQAAHALVGASVPAGQGAHPVAMVDDTPSIVPTPLCAAPPAPVPAAPAERKVLAVCPGPDCAMEHRLRVRSVSAGPGDAAVRLAFACTRCARPFHVVLRGVSG
ncbi:hypothetical protein T492DRAFT_45915 [Pavlovales sp. CCMP2436]|nr:hypothetical protein T492DRAFT_45915 [Pavlovales sp. CCMP2436]